MADPYAGIGTPQSNDPYAGIGVAGGDILPTLQGYQPSLGQGGPVDTPSAEGQGRPAKEIFEDLLTRAASAITFGQIEKASAWLDAHLGKGTYEENLAKRQKETEEAGQRLGPAGAATGDVLGGALTGASLARLPALWGSAAPGLTIAGRVAPEAGVLTKAAAGAAEGAAYGAADAAGRDQDILQGAKQGAMFGGGVGAAANIIPRAITPLYNRDPVRAAQIATLEAAGARPSVAGPEYMVPGIPTYASQRTGSNYLQMAENAAAKMPLNIPRNAARNQMENVTDHVAAMSGVPRQTNGQMPRLTPNLLDQTADDVGATIGNIQRLYPVQIDSPYLGGLIKATYDARVLRNGQDSINEFVRRLNPTGATLDPAEAIAIRGQLRRAITKGQNADPTYNDIIAGLRDTLDDALERTIQRVAPANLVDQHIGQLLQARQQYANLHVLMDALSRSGQSGARGILTPGALAAALKYAVGKTSYMRGRGDLNEIANASQSILSGKEGSGTAERSLLYHIMFAPMTLGAGLPMNLAINSRPAQAYLGNQLVGDIPSMVIPPAISGLLEAGQGRKRGGLL